MSQPRNNLDALQRQIPLPQKSSYFAAPQSPKPNKFKPAIRKAGNDSAAIAQSGIPELPSFSTPGYGRQKPRPPASSSLHTDSSNEAIDISPSNTTSPTSTSSILNKRSSSDLAPVLPNSPKRPRITPSRSDKESAYSALLKGKGRELQTPPPSQYRTFNVLGSLTETAPSTSAHLRPMQAPRRAGISSRSFVYNHKVHTDLQDKTSEELDVLYNINNKHFDQVRRDRDQFRMRKASNCDLYILEGLLDLLQDRILAIADAIGACRSDVEATSILCEPGAEYALSDASTTRTHSYDSIYARETPMHETQVINEEFGEDGACISSASRGSTTVTDMLDNDSGANVTLDPRAQATTNTVPSPIAFSSGDVEVNDSTPTTLDSRSSRCPAFPAADEFNHRREVDHGPASDDELWDSVGGIEDDGVYAVSPEANQPTPWFSAVASLRPPPAETPSEVTLKNSCYYQEVVEKLRSVFHLKTFRKNQLAAIISTLEGRDTLVLMPTGGGKSLCYQLPAVCSGGKTRGVTIVFSPLKALMLDQVETLRSRNIDVMMLTAAEDQDGNTMHELQSASNKPSIVYITPEKLDSSDRMKAILRGLRERGQLARFVIDEAHLINTWGRNFRAKGYAALFSIRKDYPGIPIVALTATATSETLQDIVNVLELRNYVLLSQSFNRPNLRYKVITKKSKTKDLEDDIVQFINEKHPNETGIIYCISRAKTEEIAMRLRDKGLKIRHFHALLSEADKRRVQQQWQSDECKIIVATIAFGMGIDKANVRFVIHYDVPASIDEYCQETGRAGRDGKVADCILYYSFFDICKRFSQINKDLESDEFQKDRKRQAVHDVVQFCLNEVDCRRKLMLNHFTEEFDPASCKHMCDNCASPDGREDIDLSMPAVQFVKMMQELESKHMKITAAQSINAFRGSLKQDMAKKKFNTVGHFGKGSSISAVQVKRLCDHLIGRRILIPEIEDGDYAPIAYIYLGPKANEFLANPSFILSIRSGKGAVGAPKPKMATEYRIPPVGISVRKKRRQVEMPDDAIGPFSPGGIDPNFDDIEPEPASGESSIPPLLQARRLRADPSIQVIENHDTGASDPTQCYSALCALRAQLAKNFDVDEQEILSDETLQVLSCTLPNDVVSFKQALEWVIPETEEVQEKWDAFGGPFLDITSKLAIRARAESNLATFSPAEMHKLFDYCGASSSKSLGG